VRVRAVDGRADTWLCCAAQGMPTRHPHATHAPPTPCHAGWWRTPTCGAGRCRTRRRSTRAWQRSASSTTPAATRASGTRCSAWTCRPCWHRCSGAPAGRRGAAVAAAAVEARCWHRVLQPRLARRGSSPAPHRVTEACHLPPTHPLHAPCTEHRAGRSCWSRTG
jgi:hypothetical protein